MDREEVKGGAEKLGGKVKEQFGKVTESPPQNKKGDTNKPKAKSAKMSLKHAMR